MKTGRAFLQLLCRYACLFLWRHWHTAKVSCDGVSLLRSACIIGVWDWQRSVR